MKNIKLIAIVIGVIFIAACGTELGDISNEVGQVVHAGGGVSSGSSRSTTTGQTTVERTGSGYTSHSSRTTHTSSSGGSVHFGFN